MKIWVSYIDHEVHSGAFLGPKRDFVGQGRLMVLCEVNALGVFQKHPPIQTPAAWTPSSC